MPGIAARADMRMGAALAPGPVALEMLAALGRRGTVRPGWLSKALELTLAPLPRAGRVRILERVMAGMTAHRAQAVCHDAGAHGDEEKATRREGGAPGPA